MDPNTRTHQCQLTSKNLHQLCADTGCSLEDQLVAMVDRDRWKSESQGYLRCHKATWSVNVFGINCCMFNCLALILDFLVFCIEERKKKNLNGDHCLYIEPDIFFYL